MTVPAHPADAIILPALEAQLARELELTRFSGPQWTRPRRFGDGPVYDVAVVGGGQSGLATAFGLRREGVHNVIIIDENEVGREGPWPTYARMITLRTPKDLTPIDFGLPSLTFRAWYEAQYGAEGWEQLDKIPRGTWMDYLRWYRRVLDLPVANGGKVTSIEPLPGAMFRLMLAGGDTLIARKVVLATGIQGGGEWHTPALIKDKLPRQLYAHTSEPIDFSALVGKRIGILGGGASAFDNANFALGEGVAAVEVFIRRKELPRVNPIRFMEKVGLAARYPALDDADKYRAMACFLGHNQPPTNDTFRRAASWPGFDLHLGSPWLDVEAIEDGRQVRVTTPHGEHQFDFVVLSTGLISDPALRPELALVAPAIARWADKVPVPDGIDAPQGIRDLIAAHPYLGPAFEFLPLRPDQADQVHGLFAFNYSALLSLGLSASALSGLQQALPKLASGIADQLFLDDKEANLAAFIGYADHEFVQQWPRQADVAGQAA
jgi:cation diffusion facilitator CzcD-associated flavoprotein CzcO